MSDNNFHSEFFEPIFLKLAVLNYKLKTGEELSEKDKMFYDIIRYAFPIISRLMGDTKMSLSDAISITTQKQTTQTQEVKTTTPTNTTTTTYSYNNTGYGFTNANASSEDCPSDEVDATPETKELLSKLDEKTSKIIELTRNRDWISVNARDLVDDDDSMEDGEENDSSTEEDESLSDDNRNKSTIITPVGKVYSQSVPVTKYNNVYSDESHDEYDDDHERYNYVGKVNTPDMEDYDQENVVSGEMLEDIPLNENMLTANI